MIKLKNSNIYVVMYHYVRDIKKSKYPNIKGLEFKDFKKQIKFFLKKFNILNNDDFIDIIETGKLPKKKSIFLTFDDGYADHWNFVFPYLKKNKISGNFYCPIDVIKNKKVLDVNKIHFILEKEENTKKILDFIFKCTKKYMNKSVDNLSLEKINTYDDWDNKETVLIKRLLQTHLPLRIRNKIINKLFSIIIDESEAEFASKLYMNKNNLVEMYKNKMTIGSHGVNHYWWKDLNYNNQLNEIEGSIKYFKKNKIYNNNFSVCYPYGSYNRDSLKILKKLGIKFALTTKIGTINKKNIIKNFEYPRFDTNEFK
jgi:peptidoglycan/xylan/chitin deacetylase (PgdA/CDA1 family)